MYDVDEIDDRRPLLGPNGLNDKPLDPTTLKEDTPLKLGETKTGQLTFFPPQPQEPTKTSQENS